jgi:cysteine-rich repeat protein
MRTCFAVLAMSISACFDASLDVSEGLPIVGCYDSEDCPDELTVCSQRVSLCVPADAPCVDRAGYDRANGFQCGDADVCVDGACVVSLCGDGMRSFDEECDDGNNVDTDTCSRGCLASRCGDGVVQSDEECDLTPDCSTSCTVERCIAGEIRCNGERREECEDGVFALEQDCASFQATCEAGGQACINDVGSPCFDGEGFTFCLTGACHIDGVSSGMCIDEQCAGPPGQCAGSNFQAACQDGGNLIIDCGAAGATCVDRVGCVFSSKECIFPFSECADENGRVEPCQANRECPGTAPNADGNDRVTPTTVELPATVTFDLVPSRDEDCFSFTLLEERVVLFSVTMPEPNCDTAGGDPQFELLDETGARVFREDDISSTNLCTASSATLVAGTYRACVAESVAGTRGDLFNVTLTVEVREPIAVSLPYTALLATLEEAPTCFSFVLDEPANLVIDAGVDDPRCGLSPTSPDSLDTVVYLGDLVADDSGPNLCGRLVTAVPLPSGPHLACVGAYDDTETDVRVEIRAVP